MGGGGHSFGGHSSFSHSSFSHSSFGGHYGGFNSYYVHSSFAPVHAGFSTVPSMHAEPATSAHSLQTAASIQAAKSGTALHAGYLSPSINPTHLDRVPLNVNEHHGLMSGLGHGFARFFGFGHTMPQAQALAMAPAVAPSLGQFGRPSLISSFPLTQTLAMAMLCSPAFLNPNSMMSPNGYSRINSAMVWNNYGNNYSSYSNWNNWYNNPLPATSFYSPYFAYPGVNALDATLAQAFYYPTFEPFPYFGQYFDRLDPAPWLLPGPNAISDNYPVPLGTPFPVSKLDNPQTSEQAPILGDSRVVDPELVPFDMSKSYH